MKIFLLLTFFTLSVFLSNAQTSITTTVLNGQTVELTVTSDKAFYVGDNIHVLYIGSTVFKHNKQTKKSLTFLIPLEAYNLLLTGDQVFMSYGDRFRNPAFTQQQLERMARENPNAIWYLGTFDKQTFKK